MGKARIDEKKNREASKQKTMHRRKNKELSTLTRQVSEVSAFMQSFLLCFVVCLILVIVFFRIFSSLVSVLVLDHSCQQLLFCSSNCIVSRPVFIFSFSFLITFDAAVSPLPTHEKKQKSQSRIDQRSEETKKLS